MVANLRDHGLLEHALVSQDAGWYSVGEPNGGTFRAFDTVFTAFIPALRREGFTQDDIETLFVRNPAKAFSIGKRLSLVPFSRRCARPTRTHRATPAR